MPPTSARQANVKLGAGNKKKPGIKWFIRVAIVVWGMTLALLIRGSYKHLGVVLLNAESEQSQQQQQHISGPLPHAGIHGNKYKREKKPIDRAARLPPPPPQGKSEEPVSTIAHAISFLNCGYALVEKYMDAMLVLRHSIHRNSWHHNNSTSRYSYRMYAFVNNDPDARCARYAPWIQRMGYTPLLLPNPINLTAIDNQFFREQIDRTGVAGSSELIKLYLYILTDYPIACHWDIDVIIKVCDCISEIGGGSIAVVLMISLILSLFMAELIRS
jgi:hypothetical protein